mmetsp:Transcript_7716/g.16005  ORF Transcript_7716/g.16005 Transcript_7716/m.16005 type:complete len:518 (-) Transcript_7716:789-2342(-)
MSSIAFFFVIVSNVTVSPHACTRSAGTFLRLVQIRSKFHDGGSIHQVAGQSTNRLWFRHSCQSGRNELLVDALVGISNDSDGQLAGFVASGGANPQILAPAKRLEHASAAHSVFIGKRTRQSKCKGGFLCNRGNAIDAEAGIQRSEVCGNRNCGNVAVIQKQDNGLKPSCLLFNHLCSVPALSASVVKEGGNNFVHLQVARFTLGSIVGCEHLHAIVNCFCCSVALNMVKEVCSTANFTDSDRQELVRCFYISLWSRMHCDGLVDRPDSNFFRLCRGLSVHEFLWCFAVIDFSLVDRREPSTEKLDAVVSLGSTLSNKYGSNNDSTECDTRAVDFHVSLENGQTCMALGSITKGFGCLDRSRASVRRRGLWASQGVGRKHDMAIFRGKMHLETSTVETIFYDSLELSSSNESAGIGLGLLGIRNIVDGRRFVFFSRMHASLGFLCGGFSSTQGVIAGRCVFSVFVVLSRSKTFRNQYFSDVSLGFSGQSTKLSSFCGRSIGNLTLVVNLNLAGLAHR